MAIKTPATTQEKRKGFPSYSICGTKIEALGQQADKDQAMVRVELLYGQLNVGEKSKIAL